MEASNVTSEEDLAMTSPDASLTVAPSVENAGVWVVVALNTWGIVSSLVLLLLIWTRKELRYNSYMWLISNCAFTCLLACSLVTPAIIHQDLRLNSLPEGLCFIYGFLVWVVHFMIPVSLLMVLIDRIVYVCDPIVYVRKMGTGALFAMIFIPWITAVVLAACSFVPFRGEIQQRELVDALEDYKYCIVRMGFQYVQSRAKFVVSLYYAFPIILVVAAMLVLMISLCHRRHCWVNHLDEFDFEFEDTRKTVCRAVVPVSLVTFVYFALFLPSLVALFHKMETGEELATADVVMWVFISFEWIQALLWMMFVTDIRNAAIRVFCCWCLEERDASPEDYKYEKSRKHWHRY